MASSRAAALVSPGTPIVAVGCRYLQASNLPLALGWHLLVHLSTSGFLLVQCITNSHWATGKCKERWESNRRLHTPNEGPWEQLRTFGQRASCSFTSAASSEVLNSMRLKQIKEELWHLGRMQILREMGCSYTQSMSLHLSTPGPVPRNLDIHTLLIQPESSLLLQALL